MNALARYVGRFRGFGPDARRFLVVSLVYGAALSLFWIDFNLFLASIGLVPAQIGLIVTASSVAGALAAIPAGLLADRFGRRLMLIGGTVLVAFACLGCVFAVEPLMLGGLAMLFGVGGQAISISSVPFMTEHSTPEQRNELFSLQFAIGSFTNVAAAVLGGLVAGWVAQVGGYSPDGPVAYRAILVLMFLLVLVALVLLAGISDDRPARTRSGAATIAVREPSAERRPVLGAVPRRHRIEDPGLFVRLLLPGFLTALGAGQVIPFLNLFVQGKFGLDLSAINALFAVTGLGTMVAILLQPAIARRFGRMGSVVLVQGASLPFLAVLGFSPVLWTVVIAMAVRNSLMNAANPILNAFAMDQVRATERALLASLMSFLWSVGWAIAGPWYSLLQANLGFSLGYTINFVTILTLYTTATMLYWFWFGRAERASRLAALGEGATGPAGA